MAARAGRFCGPGSNAEIKIRKLIDGNAKRDFSLAIVRSEAAVCDQDPSTTTALSTRRLGLD
jgi:hypothetical protein